MSRTKMERKTDSTMRSEQKSAITLVFVLIFFMVFFASGCGPQRDAGQETDSVEKASELTIETTEEAEPEEPSTIADSIQTESNEAEAEEQLNNTENSQTDSNITEIAEQMDNIERGEESASVIDNIEVFTQNSIRIRNRIGTVYIDPFQMKEAPKDADFILITHEHYDHFSPEDIEKVVGDDTVLVIPESMSGKVGDISGNMRKVVTVKPGMYYDADGLEFDTVAAYNTMKSYHPKSAEWVGYILRLDNKRIYIAGDTDATKEAKAVKCDIALVPIGGTFTMDAKQAAGLINELRPEIAVPTHYGNVVGAPEDGDTFARSVKDPVKVEMKISF